MTSSGVSYALCIAVLLTAACSSNTPPPDPAPAPTPAPRRASFGSGSLQGWRIDRGRLHNPGSGGAGQGAQDGYLSVTAPGDGHTSYFLAGDAFLGDWRGYGALSLWLRSEGGSAYRSGYGMGADVEIWSGQARAVLMLPERPPRVWTSYTLPLSEERWQVHGGTFSQILSQVTEVRVRAEYGVGRDTTGLDEVLLH